MGEVGDGDGHQCQELRWMTGTMDVDVDVDVNVNADTFHERTRVLPLWTVPQSRSQMSSWMPGISQDREAAICVCLSERFRTAQPHPPAISSATAAPARSDWFSASFRSTGS